MGKCYQQLNQFDQAKASLAQALQTYVAYFPQSAQAFSCYDQDEDQEALFQDLSRLFHVQCPQSLAVCRCFRRLGDCFRLKLKYEEAGQLYMQAITLWFSRFPRSSEYAHCLRLYRLNFKACEQPERTKEHYLQAFQLYLSLLPECTGLIACLGHLARVEGTVKTQGNA